MGLKPIPMTPFPAEWLLDMYGVKNAHKTTLLLETGWMWESVERATKPIDTGNATLLFVMDLANYALLAALIALPYFIWRAW